MRACQAGTLTAPGARSPRRLRLTSRRVTRFATLTGEARTLDAGTAAKARALLLAYGSCSTSEPIDDLRALGLTCEERNA